MGLEMDRLAVEGNLLDKVADLEKRIRALEARGVGVDSIDELGDDLGIMRSGGFVAGDGDPNNNSEDPFTGAAVIYPGIDFDGSGTTYEIVGMNAGVLEVGIDNTGKLLAGGGAVTLGANGLEVNASGVFFSQNGGDDSHIGIQSTASTGQFYAYAGAVITVPNGDFETGSMANWTVTAGTVTASSTKAHSGTYSAKFTDTGDSIESSAYLAVGSASGTVSFYANMDIYSALNVFITCYDAVGTLLGTANNSLYMASDSNLLPEVWKKYVFMGKYPANTENVKLEFLNGTGTIYLDDISFNDGYGVMLSSGGTLSGSEIAIENSLAVGEDLFVGGTMYASNGAAVLKGGDFTGILVANGNLATVAAGATSYFGFGSVGIVAVNTAYIYTPYATKLRNMVIGLRTNQPATGSLVISLVGNDAVTYASYTFPAGGGGGAWRSVAVLVDIIPAGVLIAIKVVNNASTASSQIASITMGYGNGA